MELDMSAFVVLTHLTSEAARSPQALLEMEQQDMQQVRKEYSWVE
jgi:hypothetical protein